MDNNNFEHLVYAMKMKMNNDLPIVASFHVKLLMQNWSSIMTKKSQDKELHTVELTFEFLHSSKC